MSWEKVDFETAVKDITGGNRKFQGFEYNKEGRFPIIDQGDGLIAGYTDEINIVRRAKEIVVFGDHTKSLKYVDFDFCLGADGVKVLQPYDQLDSKFFYYYLKTINLPKVGYSRHYKFLKNLQIPLPPLPIQQRIAEILDAADALKRKDQELLKKYDELAQAIFIDMFGDPVRNEKGWEVKKLGFFFKSPVKCGPFGSALKREEFQPKGIPVWNMDNIQDYKFNAESSLHISEEKYKDLKSYLVQNGDIIISRAGTVGKMCVVNTGFEKSIISTNLIKISLNSDLINPLFFVTIMKYFGKRIGRLRTGSECGFTHMNTGVLQGLEIPVPPVKFQNLFVELVGNLTSQSECLDFEPDNLFNSLIQKAFKGELIS